MDTSSLKKTDTVFCETQWRHLMKTRSYNTPPPYFILWNAVTSLGESKVIWGPIPHTSLY